MEPLDDALNAAWEDATSGAADRAGRAVDAFRALIPRTISERGEASDAYCSALEGLAHALDDTGEKAESREMYDVLAAVWESRVVEFDGRDRSENDDEQQERAGYLNQALRARALAVLIGVREEDVSRALAQLEALISRSEAELGPESGSTLWLLARRAQQLVRLRGAQALDAYDLLIARAARGGEGEHNHLMALSEKATELSRLDLDEESALLWERVLEGRRALIGLEDPSTLDAWWWLVRTLWWSGQAESAERETELLLPAMQRAHGEDSPEALNVMNFRAELLQRRGRREESGTAALEQSLTLVRRMALLEGARFGPESHEVFRSRGMAVDLLDDLARYEEARAESAALFRDVREELGQQEPLVVTIGSTRQFVLGHLWNELVEDQPERAEEVKREGLNEAEELCELAVEQALFAARQGEDAQDRLRSLARVVHYPANWHPRGSDERAAAIARWADRLAVLGDAELQGQHEVVSAEIALRDRRARDSFDAEQLEQAVADYERSLALEHRLAEFAETAAAAPKRIAQAEDALGVTLRRLGRTAESEQLLARAITRAAEAGVDEEILTGLRNSRALALQELGRTDEAAQEMRALYDASGDPSHAVDLAVVYLNGGRPRDAEALLAPVLARLEEDGAGRTPTALRIMGNLAFAACQQDRDAEAAAAYDRLYDAQVQVFGEHHRDTMITLHNRALEESHLGNYAEAVRRLSDAFALREEHLGARDPQTLSTLESLADAHRYAGNLQESRELSEMLIGVSREVLGATHPATLRRTRDLEDTLEKLGASSEARQQIESEVRESFASEAGDSNAALRYAKHLLEQDRPGDALIEYARAREGSAVSGGLDLLAAERGIAECHRRMGNDREAAEAFAKVVPQIERLLPGDHWALANALNSQSFALSNIGRVDELVEPQRRAIEVADSAGSDVERSIWLRIWLGRRLAGNGQHEPALIEYQAARETAEQRLGSMSQVALEAADDVAETLAELGRHKEALRIYRTNIPAMEKVLGADSSQVGRAKRKQKQSVDQAKGKLQSIVGAIAVLGVLGVILWGEYGGQIRSGDPTPLIILCVAFPLALLIVFVLLWARKKKRNT